MKNIPFEVSRKLFTVLVHKACRITKRVSPTPQRFESSGLYALMAHLHYFTYKGVGEKYSQAVKIGDLIDCSGQGGWDPETDAISTDLETEITQAFKNVELNLKVNHESYIVRDVHGCRREVIC